MMAEILKDEMLAAVGGGFDIDRSGLGNDEEEFGMSLEGIQNMTPEQWDAAMKESGIETNSFPAKSVGGKLLR